jgi:hypothetical protein
VSIELSAKDLFKKSVSIRVIPAFAEAAARRQAWQTYISSRVVVAWISQYRWHTIFSPVGATQNFRTMKTLTIILGLLFVTAAFAQKNDILVQGEKKLNTDFKKYKTYGWLNADNPGGQIVQYIYEEPVANSNKRNKNGKDEYVVYSYGFFVPSEDPGMNKTLTEAIEYEMEGRGYKKSANPDLLVGYRILDHKSKIKGYSAPPTQVQSREVRQPKDTLTYAIVVGTVFLSMVDAKTGQMVWEGFASGVGKDNKAVDPARLKEAANLIFSKYEFRADKYTAGNK